jgi:hypothetical protein
MITRETDQADHHPKLKSTPRNATDKEIHEQGHNSEAPTTSANQEIPHVYTTQKFIILSVRARLIPSTSSYPVLKICLKRDPSMPRSSRRSLPSGLPAKIL